jgi:uncharacterized membrane protein YgdD (TMEM256/DUF423 family)
MHKGFLKTACILAALTVALGAFGAHTLKNYVSNNALATFETGVRYQFYHVFALLATGILYKDFPFRATRFAGWLFITGILFFSGSLYMLAVLQATVQPGFRWIGAITPLGGVCFIGGWLALLVSFFKKN